MKNLLKSLFVMFICIAVFFVVLISGCKQEAVETTMAETTITETTMAEVDKDSVDSFIIENREWFKKYHTSSYYDWIGPNGETIAGDSELVLTEAEVEKIKEGKYTYAVIANNMAGEYMVGLSQGLEEFFNHVGMTRVAFTTAEFDPIKQKSDVESVLALNPDLIIGHPTDPTTAAESFKPAVDAGIPIAMLDQLPKGYEYGKDIIGVCTENHKELGIYSADAANEVLGDEGKLGVVYYDDVYYVCNILDDTFVETIETKYPDMEIVAKQGWVEEPKAGDTAAGMILTNPEVEGFWVTYMTPAQGVISTCRDANRTDIKIFTYGIDVPILMNVAQGGPVVVSGASPWNIGMNLAIMGCYGLLEKKVPNPYITVPSFMINKDNIKEVWENSMHYEMPDNLKEAVQ